MNTIHILNLADSYINTDIYRTLGRNTIIDIFNEIIQGGHAVNIESIRKHHPGLFTQNDAGSIINIQSLLEPLQLFITTWQVVDILVLPLVPGEPYDFSVKWGDGSGEEKIHLLRGWNADGKNTGGTHHFDKQGTYTITITGALRGFHRLGFNECLSLCAPFFILPHYGTLISVEQWGLVQLTSCQNMFSEISNPDVIVSPNAPDLRWCTDMSNMFAHNPMFNIKNICRWDVSNVTTMEGMFFQNRMFKQPIGDWDVSNVTNMRNMFCGCDVFNQPLWWDVAKVVDMSGMFQSCLLFNKPIGGWEVHNVRHIERMFENSAFNQYIGGWALSNNLSIPQMRQSSDIVSESDF
jgi:surface protein